jgi:hypothetical protein
MYFPIAAFPNTHHVSSVSVPTSRLLAQARLLQSLPVPVRIINRKFLPRSQTFWHHNRPLHTQPNKQLELAVGYTAVVDELGEVPPSALPDLVGRACSSLTLHDVHVLEIFSHNTYEFSNWSTPLEGAARYETVIATIFGAEDLHGTEETGARAKEVAEAFALVLLRLVGL